MFFDARAAKLLKSGEHLAVDGCPGLRLLASATRRTWTYRYRAPGDNKLKQLALGHWPAMPVQAAAAEWDKLRGQRAAGTDPGQARRDAKQDARPAAPGGRTDPEQYTVQQIVDEYITAHLDRQRKPAGAKAARKLLQRFLSESPALAARPGVTVNRADAFDELERRKDLPTMAAKLRSLLGGAWDYALDGGRLPPTAANWWRVVLKGRLKSKGKIMGGKHIGKTRTTLPAPQIGQLLAWLDNLPITPREGIEMYLWTCVRGVEIFSMRAEHIGKEADGTWWTVPKELTKNARYEDAVDLRVPLVGRALEIVERRLKVVGASGYLWLDDSGDKYEQHRLSTYIYDLQPYSPKSQRRQGAGLVLPVTGWTPHNLRRSSRTLLAGLGCSNEIGEAILGHLPAEIVGTYNAYSYDKERRLWLGKLSQRLGELRLQAQAAAPALPARP